MEWVIRRINRIWVWGTVNYCDKLRRIKWERRKLRLIILGFSWSRRKLDWPWLNYVYIYFRGCKLTVGRLIGWWK